MTAYSLPVSPTSRGSGPILPRSPRTEWPPRQVLQRGDVLHERVSARAIPLARGWPRTPQPRTSDLIGEFSTGSEEFGALWVSHDLREHRTDLKLIHYPNLGDIDLSFEARQLSADRGLQFIVFTAEPGSAWEARSGCSEVHPPPCRSQPRRRSNSLSLNAFLVEHPAATFNRAPEAETKCWIQVSAEYVSRTDTTTPPPPTRGDVPCVQGWTTAKYYA
jgi:hypothetical protein